MATERPCPRCGHVDDGTAPDCTCDWPAVRYRNMTGHHPSCPVHAWRMEKRRGVQ